LFHYILSGGWPNRMPAANIFSLVQKKHTNKFYSTHLKIIKHDDIVFYLLFACSKPAASILHQIQQQTTQLTPRYK
jgi:hypothetical protein